VQEAANAAELKRIIEGLPLETSAVAAVEWRLVQLDPPSFAALLTELARDNHAFRCAALIHPATVPVNVHGVRLVVASETDRQAAKPERIIAQSLMGCEG
jgi:hypothetical protein